MDTIPDVIAQIEQYIDIYALTGIAIGTPLLIQNKSESRMVIQISPTQPIAQSNDGTLFHTREEVYVDTGASGCTPPCSKCADPPQ